VAPPTALDYPQPAPDYPIGAAIVQNVPIVAGAAPTDFTVKPPLPSGLKLDPVTGIVTGIPDTPTPRQVYEVTASNNGGYVRMRLHLGVSDPAAPPAFSYPGGALTLQQLASLTPPLAPVLLGPARTGVTYSDNHALPAGLSVDPHTGAISGVASGAPGVTTATITASIGASSVTASLTVTITANPVPPPAFGYPGGLTVQQLVPMATPVAPVLAGPAGTGVTFSDNHTLPAGLTVDPHTGAILGTPTGAPGGTTATITATNGTVTVTATLTVTVTPPAPAPAFTYTPLTFQVGTAAGPLAPTPDTPGLTYTHGPLPPGLAVMANGRLQGTPTSSGTFPCQVTATDAHGQNTVANLTLTVNPLPPPAFNYPGGALTLGQLAPVTPPLAPVLTGPAGTGVTYNDHGTLPPGLTVDTHTGAIAGAPNGAPGVTTATITATNVSGNVTANLTVTVTAAPAPTGLTYTNVATSLAPGLLVDLAPTVTGGPVNSYALSQVPLPNPALPAGGPIPTLTPGLTLNTTTGLLSGIPAMPTTAAATGQSIGITATGPGGSVNHMMWLEVDRSLLYREMERIYTPGVPIPELRPINTALAVAPVTYAVHPTTLPPGLSFNTGSGAFYGTPTGPSPRHVYRVTATNAGGSIAGDVAITAQASRRDALAVPFVTDMNTTTLTSRFVDFPTALRTRQYETLYLPKAPMFHSYDPLDLAQVRWTGPYTQVQTNLCFKLSATFFPALPQSVRTRIAALGLTRDRVAIFCVSQNLTWDTSIPGVTIIFRPQGWTDPDAPYRGHYNTHSPVQVGLFETDPGIHFTGRPANDFFAYPNITAHVDGDIFQAPLVISSDNGPSIEGLMTAAAPPMPVSTSFFTVTETSAYGSSRAAVTLHLILDDNDQAIVEGLALHANNLGALITAFDASPLAGSPMVRKFKALFRPVIDHIAVTAPGGIHTVTLTGSGFQGASAVQVGVQPAVVTHNTDDSITATVPHAPATGDAVTVTTPYGANDPALVP
jgi:hypothetical protein